MLKCGPKGVLLIAKLVPAGDVLGAFDHSALCHTHTDIFSDPSLLPPDQTSRIVGTVALSFHPDTMQPCPTLPPPSGGCYLSNMAVDAKFRRCVCASFSQTLSSLSLLLHLGVSNRQGIGKALISASDAASRNADLKFIHLHVRQSDPGPQMLYKSCDFKETDRDNAVLAGIRGVKPRILMRKDLQ